MKGIPKEVLIPGVGAFPSMKEACKHEGISYSALTLRLRNDYYSPEKTHNRKWLALGLPTKLTHYTVGTFVTFSSFTEAAKQLKIGQSLLHWRQKNFYYGKEDINKTIHDMWKPRLSA